MIWKRTIATQMVDARLVFETVTIALRRCGVPRTGRHIEFPGYFRAYVEGRDDPEAALDDQEAALPPLTTESQLDCKELEALSHETKPPARFTEATLVRTLEAEGIGRPSTYASIIGTIQDRGYVRKQANQLVPTFTAMAVTKLLEKYFPRLVDVGFTAKMEQTLDDISNGEAERLPYLKSFYAGSDGLVEQVKSKEETIDPREACSLKLDSVAHVVRVGRFGPYFEQQSNGKKLTVSIPNDVAPAEISQEVVERLIEEKERGAEPLGIDPDSGLPIFVLAGRFGPYLQLGEVQEEDRETAPCQHPEKDLAGERSPSRAAVRLLSLPRTLGDHPESGKPVKPALAALAPMSCTKQTPRFISRSDRGEHSSSTGGSLRRLRRRSADVHRDAQASPQTGKRHSLAGAGPAPGRRHSHCDFRGSLWAVRQIRRGECDDPEGDRHRGCPPGTGRPMGGRQNRQRPRRSSPQAGLQSTHERPARRQTKTSQAAGTEKKGPAAQEGGESQDQGREAAQAAKRQVRLDQPSDKSIAPMRRLSHIDKALQLADGDDSGLGHGETPGPVQIEVVADVVPSGTTTPLSMMARRIFACRPTETPSNRMLSCTWAQLLTRTLGERIDPRRVRPK